MKKRVLAVTLSVIVTANTIGGGVAVNAAELTQSEDVVADEATEEEAAEEVVEDEVEEPVDEEVVEDEVEEPAAEEVVEDEVEEPTDETEEVVEETAEVDEYLDGEEQTPDEEEAEYTVSIKNADELIYNGKAQSPEVEVKKGEEVVAEDSYDVTYYKQEDSKEPVEVAAKDLINAGTYSLDIISEETKESLLESPVEFTIAKATLTADDLKLDAENGFAFTKPYTGKSVDVASAVRDELKKNKTFKKFFGDNYLLSITTEIGEVSPTAEEVVGEGDDEQPDAIINPDFYDLVCEIDAAASENYESVAIDIPVDLTVTFDLKKNADLLYTDVKTYEVEYTGADIDLNEEEFKPSVEVGFYELVEKDGEYVKSDDVQLFNTDKYDVTFSKLRKPNAGKATTSYTITPTKGSYLTGKSTRKTDVTVAPKIIDAKFELSKDVLPYTGKEQKAPAIKNVYYSVYDSEKDVWNDIKLAKTDYEVVTAESGTEPKTDGYKVSIKAKEGGNYTFEETDGKYYICKSASKFVVDIDPASITYGDKAPAITVYESKESKTELARYRDYYVDDYDYKAGTVKVEIVGMGEYTGVKKASFKVQKKTLTSENIEVAIDDSDLSYTGSAVKPAVAVSLKAAEEDAKAASVELVEGKDYVVSYSNNVKAGAEATVTIKGIGNYAGTVKNAAAFTVAKLNLKDATIVVNPIKASKKAWKKAVTVMKGDKILKLTAGKDYTISVPEDADYTKAGDIEVTVNAVENSTLCEGTNKGELHVYEADVKELVVVVNDGKKVVYDGKEKTADLVKVYAKADKKHETPLTEDLTITLSGEDKTNAGATIIATVKGTGKYAGEKTVKFKIQKMALKDAGFAWVEPDEEDGVLEDGSLTYFVKEGTESYEPAYTGVDAELLEASKCVITWKNNTGVTTAKKPATVTIKGNGNFSGTVTLKFAIAEKPADEEPTDPTPDDNELPMVPIN